MPELGIMLPDELYHQDLETTIRFAKRADDAGFHSVWKGEASASSGLMALSAVARETDRVRLGTGVANVYSRTPSLLGMSAGTLDALSGGRTILGLGISSEPMVENWHGLSFDRPLRRLRESIEIIRETIPGGTVDYDGEIFDVGPFRSLVESPRESVPIYNAAIGEVNRRFTGEFADGWLPAFIPERDFAACTRDVRAAARDAGRDPDDVTVAPMVGTAVDEDPDAAEWRMREFIAQEMAMGYNEQVRTFGFGEAGDRSRDLWLDGDRDAAAEVLPDGMIDQLAIYGTPEDCREGIRAYEEMGADVVVVFPSYTASPEHIEDVMESMAPMIG